MAQTGVEIRPRSWKSGDESRVWAFERRAAWRALCAPGEGLNFGKGRGLSAGHRYCARECRGPQPPWTKSCQGLEMRETGRENAFCAHAIFGAPSMVEALRICAGRGEPVRHGTAARSLLAGHPLRALNGEGAMSVPRGSSTPVARLGRPSGRQGIPFILDLLSMELRAGMVAAAPADFGQSRRAIRLDR